MKKYNWQTIKKNQKKKLNQTDFFIFGSRDLTSERIITLTKKMTQRGKLLWGCFTQNYIQGLENCEQFKTLSINKLENTLNQLILKKPDLKDKIQILTYPQTDSKYVIREINAKAFIFINGSWYHAFHYTNLFYELIRKKTPYKLISPFNNLQQAQQTAKQLENKLDKIKIDKNKKHSDQQLIQLANQKAKFSFDTTFQTGAVLAKKGKVLLLANNQILPFCTAAWHYGSLKEKNFSPPQDLNHYDSIHAEVNLLIKAQKQKINLQGTSLYLNLLPCPTCAKMIAVSDIESIFYQLDHSNGQAYKLLKQMNKKITRI